MAGQSAASCPHSARRAKAMRLESTFGTGTKTLRDTACRPVCSSASAQSTLGPPYSGEDGAAVRRSAISRCTSTHQLCTAGRPPIESSTSGAATW